MSTERNKFISLAGGRGDRIALKCEFESCICSLFCWWSNATISRANSIEPRLFLREKLDVDYLSAYVDAVRCSMSIEFPSNHSQWTLTAIMLKNSNPLEEIAGDSSSTNTENARKVFLRFAVVPDRVLFYAKEISPHTRFVNYSNDSRTCSNSENNCCCMCVRVFFLVNRRTGYFQLQSDRYSDATESRHTVQPSDYCLPMKSSSSLPVKYANVNASEVAGHSCDWSHTHVCLPVGTDDSKFELNWTGTLKNDMVGIIQ